jgi:SagB-type dehydrogenase family enzyme
MATAVTGKLRAVDPLVLEAADGAFVASSPRTPLRLRLKPEIVRLLLSAHDGLDEDWERAPTAPAVRRLIEFGFLVTENAPVPSPWAEWGTTAWSFHNRIRDVEFIPGTADSETVQRHIEKLTALPRVSAIRRPPSEKILLLPRVRVQCDAGYTEVLQARRTHRDFQDATLDLDRFSDMLHYAFAPLRFADAGAMGTLQLRAAASGGARHECEAYVFVFDVRHVDPGLYLYDGIRHGLVPVDDSITRQDVERLTFQQGIYRQAAFGVFTVAVAQRMSWKYRAPTAFRFLMQNVGHVAQVFSMTATALGLGAAITGAIRNTEADELLRLDLPGEFTTFALACGIPKLHPDGLPLSLRTPHTPPETY